MISSSALLAGSYDDRLVACLVLIAVAASYGIRPRRTSKFTGLGSPLLADRRSHGNRNWRLVDALRQDAGVPFTGSRSVPLAHRADGRGSRRFLFLPRGSLWLAGGMWVSIRILSGGVMMRGGIVALHYISMNSMRLPAMCHCQSWFTSLLQWR